MHISLTPHLEKLIQDKVESGGYNNASEVVRDALRLHKARTDEDARKLERLTRLIQEGVDDIEAGRYVEVDWDDLDSWLDGLGRPERA